MNISLVFTAVGPGPPLMLRVRKLLKFSLRAFGLKCLEVREFQEKEEAEMNIKSAFPSQFLKAADLVDGDRVLTIERVDIEDVGQDRKEEKPVIAFRETQQRLILNRINSSTIADLYGDETDAWRGRRIVLTVCETDFAGKRVPALRVKTTAPPAPASRTPAPKAPAAGAAPPNEADQAKRLAWTAWKGQHKPDEDATVVAEGFRQAARAYFSGRPPELITAREWQAFIADGFVQKPLEDPLADAPPVFTDSDIPF